MFNGTPPGGELERAQTQLPRPTAPARLPVIRWTSRLCLAAGLLFICGPFLLVLTFRWVSPPTSAFMIRDQWSAVPTRGRTPSIKHSWAPLDAISPHMLLAVLAAEDQNFPHHFGFDFTAIRRAYEHNKEGNTLRGASTISQQVAKNLFLWPGQSYLRKGLEAVYTLFIELLWSKRRILEVYLNIAQFGEGVYGVEAAARVYFGKSSRQLARGQASMLAAALPNPERYSVAKPSPRLKQKAAWVLRQMRQLGGESFLNRL